MTHSTARRSLLALLALALLFASFSLTPGSAEAVTGCVQSQSITSYYSDATYSTPVGMCTTGCTGGCRCSGTITKYYRVDHLICVE